MLIFHWGNVFEGISKVHNDIPQRSTALTIPFMRIELWMQVGSKEVHANQSLNHNQNWELIISDIVGWELQKSTFPKTPNSPLRWSNCEKKKTLCFLLRYRPVWCSKSPVAVRVTKLCLYCFKHFSHSSTKLFPCNSAKDSLGKPDLQCKSSTFVVATNWIKPLQYNRAMAMCAELGCNDLFNSKSSLTVSPFNFLVQTPRGPRWN